MPVPLLPFNVRLPDIQVGALVVRMRPVLERMVSRFPSWPTTAAMAVIAYLLLCRALRYRRLKGMLKKYPYKTRESLAGMTNEDAFEIQRDFFELEFPYMTSVSLQFALFKTYGIPTISKLLVATRQLADKENAGRRAADTELLISEFVGFSPSSERANAAIARMNWQHAAYQKAGKISNDDLLYTLALFALEPRRWIAKYEWRGLSEMEQCAVGVFWKSTGDAMKISYEHLASFVTGWKDGLDWLDDVEQWAQSYEQKCMLPDAKNHKTAVETTSLLLMQVPRLMRGAGENLVITMMSERLRLAVMYPTAPGFYHSIKDTLLSIRKFYVRHLSLPRYERYLLLSEEKDKKTGRYFKQIYDMEPWYVPDTFTYRWGLQAIVRRLRGLPYPGPQWKSQGYLVEEIGPQNLEGKGLEELDLEKKRLMAAGRSGCPFAGPK